MTRETEVEAWSLAGWRRGVLPPVVARLTEVDRDLLWWWLITRISLFAVASAGAWAFVNGEAPRGFLETWNRWDVVHLSYIAEYGYWFGDYPGSTIPAPSVPVQAFFPGFPLVVRPFTWFGISPILGGLIVSAAALAVAVVVIGRWGNLVGPEGTGRLAGLLVLVSPLAVFVTAGYTEALFLAFAVGAWYAATTDRWWWAAAFAAGASTTRITGLALALGLAVLWATRAPRRRETWPAVLIPVTPVLAYFAWLWAMTGDPVAWLTAQKEGWAREFAWPWDALRYSWDQAFGAPPGEGGRQLEYVAAWRLDLAFFVIAVVAVVVMLRRRWWGEAVYTSAAVGMLMFNVFTFSLARAVLLAFPVWVIIAIPLVGRRRLISLVLAGSFALAVLYTVSFTTGRWVG